MEKEQRLCFLTRNYYNRDSAGNKAKTDNEDTLVLMGARNLGLDRTFYDSKITSFFLDLAGVISMCYNIKKNDNLFLQYPVKKYFSFLCLVAHLKGAKVMALIHDLGSFRRKKLTVSHEIARLSNADYVIASNNIMAQWLRDNGFKKGLGALQLFDYRSDTEVANKGRRTMNGKHVYSVTYAGSLNMRKNSFFLHLPEIMDGYKMHIYGNSSEMPTLHSCKNFIFHGFTPADEFIANAEGDFGLVWDGDSTESCTGNFGEYLRYNSPHKVSFYLRAGLPVIIWKDAALADFIVREGAGISIESLGELSNILRNMTKTQYHSMECNAHRLGEMLATGHFLKTAVSIAVNKL